MTESLQAQLRISLDRLSQASYEPEEKKKHTVRLFLAYTRNISLPHAQGCVKCKADQCEIKGFTTGPNAECVIWFERLSIKAPF